MHDFHCAYADITKHGEELLARFEESERQREAKRAADEEARRRREAANALIYDPAEARRKYAMRKPRSGVNEKVASYGALRRARDEINLKAWFAHGKPRLIEGIASTVEKNSHGSYKNPLGAVFDLPLPLLKSHDCDYPIGLVYAAEVSHKQIRFKAQLANAGLDRCDEVWEDILKGESLAVSTSAGMDDAFARRDVGNDKNAYILDSWRWTELSVCKTGANGSARIFYVREGDDVLIDLRKGNL